MNTYTSIDSEGRHGTNIGLWIFRGLPGTGKTTEANKIAARYKGSVFSADDYFTDESGVYRFDPKKLKEAHQWCLDSVGDELSAGRLACVANTFTQRWEVQPYIDLATELNIRYAIIHCCQEYGSVHNVPQHTIDKMRERWQHIKGEDLIYPEHVIEELNYQIARHDLEYADNYRAYRVSDGWLKESFRAASRHGCCGSFEIRLPINGETWEIGCNYGH